MTIGGIGNTLTYDANGSITLYDAASGDDTALAYDGQNNVSSITVGATPTAKDEFWYGPDGQRFLGRTTWNASGLKTRITAYLGAYDEVTPESGNPYSLVQHTQLSDTVRDIRVVSGGNPSSWFEYSHRDHLGSVDAFTDATGALIDKTSFDPFGGRRAKSWGTDPVPADITTILNSEATRYYRGFTDHEELNRTGFIHMNGRVFDPRIGRFVSADPFVQFPHLSQSYNRYSYTLNNPLSFTDPSGFEFAPIDFGPGGWGGDVIMGNSDFGWGWEHINWGGLPNLKLPPIVLLPRALIGTLACEGWAEVLAEGACAAQPEICALVIAGAIIVILVKSGDDIDEHHQHQTETTHGSGTDEGETRKPNQTAKDTAGPGGGSADPGDPDDPKKGPDANEGDAKQHGGELHNRAIDERIGDLRRDPEVTDIRKNQVQVDVDGNRVGNNLPDIQYDKGGVHHAIEYDFDGARSVRHGDVIRANDPDVAVELNRLPLP